LVVALNLEHAISWLRLVGRSSPPRATAGNGKLESARPNRDLGGSARPKV
jgi:hypothetical protein